MHGNRPKLLVILGAGSSIPCRMPSVADINKRMDCWSREWADEKSVIPENNVFNVLWEASEHHYNQNSYSIGPNYERVLGDMTMLASWLSPRPFGMPLSEALKDKRSVDQLNWLLDDSDEYAARKRVQEQHTFLLDKLAGHMRKRSRALDHTSAEFLCYQMFFDKLRDRFHVGIYNLNYDTVAGTAWDEAYNGFDRWGRFDPLCVSRRQDWNFIYHLHGSVHHSISDPVASPWIIWKKDLADEFSDCGIPQNDMAQGFRSIPLTTLLAGGFKLDQLLADPYQTFYSTLVRHVHETDAILVIGYGFGDPHVNGVLRNRFVKRPDHDGRPQPQVVVLEKTSRERWRTARRQINEFWSWELTHTFNTGFSDGSERPSDDRRTVGEFIDNENFEKDVRDGVAIWHGGFPEAFSAVDRIVDRITERLLRRR